MRVGLGLGLTRLGGGFTPAKLFAASEPGVWYDPSDLSTLFQDDAGTTPVTAAGQSVGLVLDKSGRGNHATQATAASRPTYQVDSGGRGYLSFDGVDDFLVTPTITPGTDKVQVFAGLRKLSDAAFQSIVELGTSADVNTGSFCLGASAATFDPTRRNWTLVLAGSTAGLVTSSLGYPAPDTKTITGLFDLSRPTHALEAVMRLNGSVAAVSQSSLPAGTGNFLAYPLYIGRRGGTASRFNGHLYGLQVRFGPNLTEAQIAQAERWMAARTGVTI